MSHPIQCVATWKGGFSGSGRISSPGFTAPVTLPADHGGTTAGTNPEELLAAASASCFLATLGILFEKHSIPYEAMTASAELTLSEARPPSITQIALTAKVLSNHDPVVLRDLAYSAKAICVIGRALHPELPVSLVVDIIGGDVRRRSSEETMEVRL